MKIIPSKVRDGKKNLSCPLVPLSDVFVPEDSKTAFRKNPEGAKKLVDWWLSREGQSAMSLAYMHPVKYGVKEPVGAQNLGALRIHSLSVNWNKLAVEEKQVKERFAAIMK